MADQEPNQGATGAVSAEEAPTGEPTGVAGGAGAAAFGQSPLSVDAQGGDAFDERPELFVAGAFAGGLVLAQILRRLGS
jgi:hypothetical protein